MHLIISLTSSWGISSSSFFYSQIKTFFLFNFGLLFYIFFAVDILSRLIKCPCCHVYVQSYKLRIPLIPSPPLFSHLHPSLHLHCFLWYNVTYKYTCVNVCQWSHNLRYNLWLRMRDVWAIRWHTSKNFVHAQKLSTTSPYYDAYQRASRALNLYKTYP